MIESRRRIAELNPPNRALSGASGVWAVPADLRPALGVTATRAAPRVPPVLEWLDRQLLDAYEHDFPVCEMPYAAMARRFHCRTSEVLQRLAGLVRRGVVSRIGPVFAPGRVDASTLVAMAVPGTRLDSIAEWVRRHQAVSHIDEREHEFNLWFVLAAPNEGALYEAVAEIRRRTGLNVLDLRPERDYHIDVGFSTQRGSPSGRCPATARRDSPARCPPLDASDLRLVEAIRDGLPLTARPYATVADRIGLSEAQVMERVRRLRCEGVIQRMGMVVRHRELGWGANAMVAFDVPCARVDGVGERLARLAPVTGCYRRTRRAPIWPYNLHCMLHGRDRADVMDQVEELLHEADRCVRRSVLFDRPRFGRHAAHNAPNHPLSPSERPAPLLHPQLRSVSKANGDARNATPHAPWSAGDEVGPPGTGNLSGTQRGHAPGTLAAPSGLSSWIAAAVLGISCLVLPAGPVDAAGEYGARIDLTEVQCRGRNPTAGVPDSHETSRELRIGAWRNAGEGGAAGFSHIDGERWLNLTWESVSHASHDEFARIGPRAVIGRDLMPGGGFLISAGDAAVPDDLWSGWRRPAPERSAGAHDADGAGPIGLFASDCERDRRRAGVAPTGTLSAWRVLGAYATDNLMMTGSRDKGNESPLRYWSTAIVLSLAPPDMRRGPSISEWAAGLRAALRPDGSGPQTSADTVPGATGAGELEAAETRRARRLPSDPRERLEAKAGRIDTASIEAEIRRDGAGATSVGLQVALGLGG